MRWLKRLWKSPLPWFLLLWAVMMGTLGGLSAEKHAANVQRSMDAARELVTSAYQRIWEQDLSEEKKVAQLSCQLDSYLYEYDGVALFRFYNAQRQETAHSPMAIGEAAPPGSSAYSWQLLLDPVLSQEEQLSLAELLREDRQLQYFYGSAGGLVPEAETDERWCEITGVADRELELIYPKTITYVYADREITLVDSESNFFDGQELTTLRFDGAALSSALVGRGLSPKEMLALWQEAEEKLDRLLDGGPPRMNVSMTSSDGSSYVGFGGDGAILASTYAYSPLHLAVRELWSTAVFTLLAAVAMALYIDRKQRAALRRERAFARAAAHELKTPLAILRTHAEALREDIAPEKRTQYLDVVLDESDRMATLVSRLLSFSCLESETDLHLESVAFSALVQEVFRPLALSLEQKHISLTLELEEGTLTGDRERLREAVENLAANALAHCPPGGQIRVTLKVQEPLLRLTVYNDGAPIPAEDLPHLFEPFYRGDKSRSRESGGTGLGLAIVQAAAAAHGGSCLAENRNGGVAFILRLSSLSGEAGRTSRPSIRQEL